MANEYISKIGNVVDKVKNATFEVKINDIKIIDLLMYFPFYYRVTLFYFPSVLLINKYIV